VTGARSEGISATIPPTFGFNSTIMSPKHKVSRLVRQPLRLCHIRVRFVKNNPVSGPRFVIGSGITKWAILDNTLLLLSPSVDYANIYIFCCIL